jgi:galactofuranosylgalactofuranosylrhamnosyl-N-acetylglucosaminyl-diphospho-decaprenol beta-1,5/1,6-galactofuranosyltransferase
MRGYIVDQQHSVFGQQKLVVQRAFFAAAFPETPDDLYAQGTKGVVERARQRVAIQPHAELSTNTFFGRFPASYWQRWTDIEQIEFRVLARGSGRIAIRASDVTGDVRTIAITTVEGATNEQVCLLARIDRFVDGGALWLEAATDAAELVLESGCWLVAQRPRDRPTAVVICTYNRADDCLRTLEALSRDDTALAMVDTVYVVDQGSDTVESQAGFDGIKNVLGAKLRYIRQPNLGGAGGFTRGLYEVTEVSGTDHAHIMFMDDDIMLEPDTVVRLTTFANCTVLPTIVGGQMLYLLHPDQLHVGAETTDLTTLRAGLPVKDALVRSNLTYNRQEIRVDAEYNAWWTCLIPSEVVTEIGFPLPLFFQWDDIEYALRARAHGYATVTLPGAGVWHTDFHWKDWDDWPRYFSLRNSLIVSALYGQPKAISTAQFLLGQLLIYIASMRYGLAATLIMAVEDYLAGPDTLHDGGVEAVAAVRKLRAAYAETTRQPAHGVPGIRPTAIPLTAAAPIPSRPRLVLVKRLVWQILRKPRNGAAVSARDSHWWHVSLFETAVVTDPSQEGVRVRRLDQRAMRALGKRGLQVLIRLVCEQPRIRRRYRNAMPTLTSRQNWQRLFTTPRPDSQSLTSGDTSIPMIDAH